MGVNWRAHVGKYDTTRDRFVTHSGDGFTDDGPDPTHWTALDEIMDEPVPRPVREVNE
jgi:hypothetical protein